MEESKYMVGWPAQAILNKKTNDVFTIFADFVNSPYMFQCGVGMWCRNLVSECANQHLEAVVHPMKGADSGGQEMISLTGLEEPRGLIGDFANISGGA